MSASSSTRAVVVAAILAAFLPPYMASSVTVALPTIGRTFALPPASLSWIVTAYFLAVAVFLLPFGKAGDLYGRRRIFSAGALIFCAASLLVGIAPSVAVLIAFRVLQGIGASMIFSTGTAMLTAAVPPSQRGKMLGLSVASTYLGLSLGPSTGGLLTQLFGWRSIFYTSIPLSVLIIALVAWKITKETVDGHVDGATGRQPFDYAGSLLYGASIVLLMYGLGNVPKTRGIVCTCAGSAGFAFFVWVESRRASPLFVVNLFRHNRVFVFSNLATLFSYSATTGAGFLLSLYLQYVKGLPPKHAGLIMISQPIVMAAVSPFAGRLSDRTEPRVIASIGMALTVTSLVFLSFVSPATPFPAVVAGLMLLGSGVAFFSSPNTSAIMGSVEKPLYGMASSIVATMRLMGALTSLSIATVLLGLFVGASAITTTRSAPFCAALRISFWIFGTLCVVGIFASLARGRVRAKTKEASEESMREISLGD